MDGYARGKISGLYNVIFEKQNNVKRILADYFLMTDDSISINLRSSDLSVIVYTDIPTVRKDGRFSVIIVNRLDEYVYNFDDIELLDKFKILVKNDNRLKAIQKLTKKKRY